MCQIRGGSDPSLLPAQALLGTRGLLDTATLLDRAHHPGPFFLKTPSSPVRPLPIGPSPCIALCHCCHPRESSPLSLYAPTGRPTRLPPPPRPPPPRQPTPPTTWPALLFFPRFRPHFPHLALHLPFSLPSPLHGTVCVSIVPPARCGQRPRFGARRPMVGDPPPATSSPPPPLPFW